MSLDQPSRRALVAGSIVAVAAGGAYYLTGSDERPDAEPVHTQSVSFHASEETSALGVDLSGKPIIGSPDAPIEIYYWTDFQCTYCEQFERETLPHVVSDHAEPGRARIVLVPLAFAGADSMTAAVASRCVWEQVHESDPSTYWDWHSTVMEEQGEQESGWADADNLVEYTRSVDGVDADALETCLDEQRSTYEAEIEADGAQAASLGINATPVFTVFNPESETAGRMNGIPKPEQFDERIEEIEEA